MWQRIIITVDCMCTIIVNISMCFTLYFTWRSSAHHRTGIRLPHSILSTPYASGNQNTHGEQSIIALIDDLWPLCVRLTTSVHTTHREGDPGTRQVTGGSVKDILDLCKLNQIYTHCWAHKILRVRTPSSITATGRDYQLIIFRTSEGKCGAHSSVHWVSGCLPPH